jgi:2-keto-4-pentenoate hydratase
MCSDARWVSVTVHASGEIVAAGSSALVSVHPALAIAELVNVMAEQSRDVPAGHVILSGGVVEAFAVNPGDHVRAQFKGLSEGQSSSVSLPQSPKATRNTAIPAGAARLAFCSPTPRPRSS